MVNGRISRFWCDAVIDVSILLLQSVRGVSELDGFISATNYASWHHWCKWMRLIAAWDESYKLISMLSFEQSHSWYRAVMTSNQKLISALKNIKLKNAFRTAKWLRCVHDEILFFPFLFYDSTETFLRFLAHDASIKRIYCEASHQRRIIYGW